MKCYSAVFFRSKRADSGPYLKVPSLTSWGPFPRLPSTRLLNLGKLYLATLGGHRFRLTVRARSSHQDSRNRFLAPRPPCPLPANFSQVRRPHLAGRAPVRAASPETEAPHSERIHSGGNTDPSAFARLWNAHPVTATRRAASCLPPAQPPRASRTAPRRPWAASRPGPASPDRPPRDSRLGWRRG